MGETTKIEWADHSFSPWFGCRQISGACDACYAMVDNARFKRNGTGTWGEGAPRVLSKGWSGPLRWNRRIRDQFVATGCAVTRERVFPSLCDPFDAEVSDSWRDALMVLIHATPFLSWLLLTKRPEEALRYLTRDRMTSIINHRDMVLYGRGESPLPHTAAVESMQIGISNFPRWRNLHVGVSVENQPTANHRRDVFREIPVLTKFVSYEPALGLIDWTGWEFVDQIISGGESGTHARPSHPDWHRATRDFCIASGIAYLFKQHGEFVDYHNAGANGWEFTRTVDGKRYGVLTYKDGRRSATDFETRYPWVIPDRDPGPCMVRVGKKAAGRMLDGRAWDEFPKETR